MTLKMKPLELVKVLSRGKAGSVVRRHKDSIIIGADTFIAYKNHIIGKPHTSQKAKATLRMLSGKTHSVITGYTIIDTKTHKSVSRAYESKVSFRKMTPHEISAYVKTREPLERGGGYAIQDIGSIFIKKIEGDFFGIMGLPICALIQDLKKFGVKVLAL